MATPSWLMEAIRARTKKEPVGFSSMPQPTPPPVVRPETTYMNQGPLSPQPSDLSPAGNYGLGSMPRGDAMRQGLWQNMEGITQYQPVDPMKRAREQDMVLAAVRDLIMRS